MPKKKVVKAATREDREKIDRELRKKYPGMFKPDWGMKKKTGESWVSKLKKKVRAELKRRKKAKPKTKVKAKQTQRTKDVSGSLRKAGMTQKEIDRLRGK